jgi:hypothetical protein
MDIVIDVLLSIDVFFCRFALLFVCEMGCLRGIRQSLSARNTELIDDLFED